MDNIQNLNAEAEGTPLSMKKDSTTYLIQILISSFKTLLFTLHMHQVSAYKIIYEKKVMGWS